MMDDPLIQLSQSHLKLLSLCPRKYQHTYLDQLLVPTASSQTREQAELGQQFHRIMQQHWMGLNVAPILETSPHLKSRFKAFQAHPPDYIDGHCVTEHQRRFKLSHYLLVGIFDLLVTNATQGQIIDWKSYIKPNSPHPLQNSWQSKLYPYLLANTSTLHPDQISITYWFAETQSPQDSHSITFPYSQSLHRQIHQTINTLLQQLDHWLQQYQQQQALPQIEIEQGQCHSATYQCPYLYRCQRDTPTESPERHPMRSPLQSDLEAALNFNAVPEISL